MPTTSEYLLTLFKSTDDLKATLNNSYVSTSGIDKLNLLIPLVSQIESGTGYCHATITCNKMRSLTFAGLNFVPANFAISSEYALEHTYTVTGNAYQVVGALSLEGLQMGTQTHSVEVMLNDNLSTINVMTELTNSLGISSLTVTLPEGFCFLGEYEWAVLGNTSFDDAEEEE